MSLTATIREQILMQLVQVIDPETGIDVLRMRLVEDLEVDEASGLVTYTFRPSSPLCPLAVSLATDIKHAIASVTGVKRQEIKVNDYIKAGELTTLINQENI